MAEGSVIERLLAGGIKNTKTVLKIICISTVGETAKKRVNAGGSMMTGLLAGGLKNTNTVLKIFGIASVGKTAKKGIMSGLLAGGLKNTKTVFTIIGIAVVGETTKKGVNIGFDRLLPIIDKKDKVELLQLINKNHESSESDIKELAELTQRNAKDTEDLMEQVRNSQAEIKGLVEQAQRIAQDTEVLKQHVRDSQTEMKGLVQETKIISNETEDLKQHVRRLDHKIKRNVGLDATIVIGTIVVGGVAFLIYRTASRVITRHYNKNGTQLMNEGNDASFKRGTTDVTTVDEFSEEMQVSKDGKKMNVLHSVFDPLIGPGKQGFRILLTGLDNSGKKTILSKLSQGGIKSNAQISVGVGPEDLSMENLTFVMIEAGVEGNPVTIDYSQLTIAIIFVVDVSDRARLEKAGETLRSIIQQPGVRDVTVLVLANKWDVASITTEELEHSLALEFRDTRNIAYMKCCAISGQGIISGLEWLMDTIKCRGLIG